MAQRSTISTPSANTPTDPAQPNATPAAAGTPARMDTAALDVKALATVILAREVRPGVGDIRRLAEAVLRKKQKKEAKKAAKEATKGERKLSKIPARKRKK